MLLPLPCTPAIEAVLQIAPLACRNAPTAAWVQRNGAIRFVLRIVCQKSSVSRSSSANGIGAGVAGVPALLTRKSSRTSASIARATPVCAAHRVVPCFARPRDMARRRDDPVSARREPGDLLGAAPVVGQM